MAYTIAFFGTKPYDESSFNDKNKEFGFEIRYYKGHLNKNNVLLTQGVDAVCIFVNDVADAEVIRVMAANGVKLLALRCAGFNNVDLNAAAAAGITVVRVPAYSPYAVAEYTVALMLSLNRKIPRASWRTKDGNFSLHGLMGFDMHGKTAGIIGTGKIAKILIHILKGFGMSSPQVLTDPSAFPHLYVWSAIWQTTGWSSIIYIAALSGVSPELHEAAIADGANKLQRIFYIDIPMLIPTAVILLILNCGNIMNLGFEKVYLMQTAPNLSTAEVISTYVYKIGLQGQQYSYASAIGLFNNIINFTILILVNQIAGKTTENSLW